MESEGSGALKQESTSSPSTACTMDAHISQDSAHAHAESLQAANAAPAMGEPDWTVLVEVFESGLVFL